MLSLLLAAAAVVLLFGGSDLLPTAKAWLDELRSRVSLRQAAAAALVVVAIAYQYAQKPEASPEPPPPAPAGLDLRGIFRGPTASEDAAVVGAICSELADEIDWDAAQPEPFLKTGVAIDELRSRARELRCRGVSIGERQPAARDAISVYLEQAVGTAGGPISPEQRVKWVAALREIGKAATDASR
jgi:hypothetical protein